MIKGVVQFGKDSSIENTDVDEEKRRKLNEKPLYPFRFQKVVKCLEAHWSSVQSA